MSDALTELIDAEFFVEGADTPTGEQRLRDALQHDGIDELTVAHGRVDIRYDPITVNKAEFIHIIEAAGFRVNHVETAATSPVVDMDTTAASDPEAAAGTAPLEGTAAESPVADSAVADVHNPD